MHGTLKRKLTTDDVELMEKLAIAEARESFWAYRRYIRPTMRLGWFQREVSRELQNFFESYCRGERPRLLLQSPPQHGKSRTVTEFLSWVIGKLPHTKTIFGSYSNRLGVRTNLQIQRIITGERWLRVFDSPLGEGLQRNSEIIEFAGGEGYFRNTTVDGAVNGESLELGVIDDPIKGRAEAKSKLVRDKVWDWMTDDFMSRFADHGALLMIMTRWHVDDPAGRLIAEDPTVKVLRYPAIAVEDETHRKIGEPLFPELKSLEFLEKQRGVMTQSGWESEYQQNPIVVGGGMFPIEKFKILPERPRRDVDSVVRYFDKAGTAGGGAFTSGVLIFKMNDGTYVVTDVRRGQWGALDREQIILQTAQMDEQALPKGASYSIWVEQEPGSGGKESAENTVRMLAGFNVHADRVTGDKETRAEPYAAQVQAGNVSLVSSEWNESFIDEHETFPNGKFKDQVDATAGAFNKIVLEEPAYDSSMSWVS